MKAIIVDGLSLDRVPATGIDIPDPKDIVFYEIAISKENAYLVTGNIKHFPVRSFIVSPAEMVEILGDD